MSALESKVAFFDSTYREALELTREARDYIAFQERRDCEELTSRVKLAVSCESMRLTARLTQVMAWLLVQRAVFAGEMSREEASTPEWRLSGQGICDSDEVIGADREELPERLRSLLERSHALYDRVHRLDRMMIAA